MKNMEHWVLHGKHGDDEIITKNNHDLQDFDITFQLIFYNTSIRRVVILHTLQIYTCMLDSFVKSF